MLPHIDDRTVRMSSSMPSTYNSLTKFWSWQIINRICFLYKNAAVYIIWNPALKFNLVKSILRIVSLLHFLTIHIDHKEHPVAHFFWKRWVAIVVCSWCLPCQSLRDALTILVSRPGFLDACEHWRERAKKYQQIL